MKQYVAAKKLVVVPHSTFHRLAAEVGDPMADGSRKLTLINMTARCGSTLLCQMLNTVPKCRAMSEPWAFNHAHAHYNNGDISMSELRLLVRSIMRLQCKPENDTEIKQIMIKVCTLTCPIFPMLSEMFPEANYIFNTRNLPGTMASYMQIVNSIPWIAKLIEFCTCRGRDRMKYGQ